MLDNENEKNWDNQEVGFLPLVKVADVSHFDKTHLVKNVQTVLRRQSNPTHSPKFEV